MKVIFLDVDGVLNNDFTTAKTKSGAEFIDDCLIGRLKRLVDATGAKIVMSSSWRYGRNCKSHGADFRELIDKLKEYDIEIYDYTPELRTDKKGIEIAAYVNEHAEIEKFVVLDDDDMSPIEDEHVRTLNRYGLTDDNVDEAIEMLN